MITTAWLLATGLAVLPAAFPEPEALEPNVRFWERVYAEWDSGQVVIHDREHLDVVYEVVELGAWRLYPKPTDPKLWKEAVRKRREIIGAHMDAIRAALRSLEARWKQGGLSESKLEGLERQVYAALRHKPYAIRAASTRLRWQYGLADRFHEGLERFDRWKEVVLAVFHEEGLPEDLIALAFVESLFDPHAQSPVGAHGLFQFMPATARELGLERNRLYDQRRDPELAARALARMLRRSYQRLGNWPLALTAHNHGPNGVARAIEKVGSR
ncbi:MAG: lytic transglycosylase domain-containing protein, partial [Deltaproteobacteria bacterium]